MARIPSADRLSVNVADGVAPVATVDTRNVGQGAAHLATAIDKTLDSRARYQYAQAASDFLVKKTKQDSAYDNDQEYGTIEQRYTEGTASALEQSAALIGDARVRNEFLLQYRPQVAAGVERIKGVATSRERDYQRGYIQQQLTALTDSGLTGDIPEAIGTAQALLVTARDQGYVSAQEYATMEGGFRTELASRAIKMLAPREQLAALEAPWATNLPVDARTILTREAKEAVVKEDAMVNVDGYMARILGGETRTDVQGAIESITDPAVRAATEQRFETEYGRYEKNKVDQQSALQQKYFLQVRQGLITMDQVPQEDLERMDVSVVNSLFAAESQAATGINTNSDRQVLDTLHGMKAMAESGARTWPEVRQYFVDNSQFLAQTDFDQWSQITTSGVVPPKVESFLTAQQRLSATLDVLNNSKLTAFARDAIYGREQRRFDTWYMQQQQETGRVPSDVEVTRKIDEIVLNTYSVDNEGWFTGSTGWPALTDAQKTAERARIERADPTTAADVNASLPPTATPDDFMALYLTVSAGE